jgi:hypothetical protein
MILCSTIPSCHFESFRGRKIPDAYRVHTTWIICASLRGSALRDRGNLADHVRRTTLARIRCHSTHRDSTLPSSLFFVVILNLIQDLAFLLSPPPFRGRVRVGVTLFLSFPNVLTCRGVGRDRSRRTIPNERGIGRPRLISRRSSGTALDRNQSETRGDLFFAFAFFG